MGRSKLSNIPSIFAGSQPEIISCARSADGSPLSGGEDASGDLPPELIHQLFGDAGGAGSAVLPPRMNSNPNHARHHHGPASGGGGPAAGRGAHLGTAASAPVRTSCVLLTCFNAPSVCYLNGLFNSNKKRITTHCMSAA